LRLGHSAKLPEHMSTQAHRKQRLSAERAGWLWLALLLLFAAAAPALGQGCAQCLDSTRATPPAVQAAYRHAIYLLGGAGATLFAAGTYLLRRNR
jgi:Na+/proline symporter